jgi:hypothetical protein
VLEFLFRSDWTLAARAIAYIRLIRECGKGAPHLPQRSADAMFVFYQRQSEVAFTFFAETDPGSAGSGVLKIYHKKTH